MTSRLIVTGAPGSGKTSTLERLRGRRIEVVREAATDVNVDLLAEGVGQPHLHPDFLQRIVALQRARRLEAVGDRQLHDRSAFCTLALARYLSRPVPVDLSYELDDIADWFAPTVAFFAPLGFIAPTPARRISHADALAFGEVHRDVYVEHGFTIEDIAVDTEPRRAAAVEELVSHA